MFGVDRIAIEVFPEEKRLVDVMDCYHLWILPKYFEMPFGIHPKDKKCKVVNRGVNMKLIHVIQCYMDAIKEDFYDNDNCKYAKAKDKYEVKEMENDF